MYIIVGETASGKSAYALNLAKKVNGCVINADSQQIYKELPILTAQPSFEDMRNVPHMLYSKYNYYEQISAYKWACDAQIAVQNALRNKLVPILVGGSGMYIDVFCNGIASIPNVPRIIDNVKNVYEELMQVDEVMAQQIGPHHHSRLSRALAVKKFTGKSLNEWYNEPKIQFCDISYNIERIVCEKNTLRERIIRRVNAMFPNVLQEVANFKGKECSAIGFLEITNILQKKQSIQNMKNKIVQKTMQYAKRQRTWFNKYLPSNTIYREL